MSSSRVRHLCLALLLALASGCVSTGTFDQKAAEADRLSQEVTRLRQDRKALEQAGKDLEARRSSLAAEAATLAEQFRQCETDRKRVEEMLAAAADTLPSTISDLRQQISELAGSKAALQQELDAALKSRNEGLRNTNSAYDSLLGLMQDEIARGEATVSELKGALTVTLFETLLFDPGSVILKQKADAPLRKLAGYLKGIKEHAVRVEGFTESVLSASWPLKQYPTGWELSAARAVIVARFLQNEGVNPLHLSAVAYGEYRPLSDNISELGRARNRRIQIVVIPKE